MENKNSSSLFQWNSSIKGKIIDGKEVAKEIRLNLKQQVEELKKNYDKVPGLAVILVGSRKDSQTYVRMKKKACDEVGINSYGFDFAENVTEEILLNQIDELNLKDEIDGILIQLPLPNHLNEEKILSHVDPNKDVDGLHPVNMAKLYTSRPRRTISWKDMSKQFNIPCTPKGCLKLLDYYQIPIEGKKAVILGRSNMVGMPMSILLLQRNATITICHSRTQNIKQHINEADIVIAAIGKPEYVQGTWIKEGAVIIDVGINAIDDITAKRGYRLVGDVQFQESKERASAITPVPGGVGPMTIAMLLENTIETFIRLHSLK